MVMQLGKKAGIRTKILKKSKVKVHFPRKSFPFKSHFVKWDFLIVLSFKTVSKHFCKFDHDHLNLAVLKNFQENVFL